MKPLKITIATDDKKTIKDNGHFGDAEYYLKYEITSDDAVLTEKIKNPKFQEKHHIKGGDPEKAAGMKQLLNGSDALVGRQFGQNMKRMLQEFVCVIIRKDSIDEAVAIVQKNLERIIKEQDKTERKHLLLEK